jgi:hypothetical protein
MQPSTVAGSPMLRPAFVALTYVVAVLVVAARVLLHFEPPPTILLANIVGVALLSAPTPLRIFMNEPANVWRNGSDSLLTASIGFGVTFGGCG